MTRRDYTGLFYARPTFLEGFARLLDVGGVFDEYNDAPAGAEADALATASDWYAVGADLNRAIGAPRGSTLNGHSTHVERTAAR